MPRPAKQPDNRVTVRLRDDQLKALRRKTNPHNTESDVIRP